MGRIEHLEYELGVKVQEIAFLTQRLAALPPAMTWTRDKPVRAGWYWYRHMPLIDPEMVLIRHGDCFVEMVSMVEVLPLDLVHGEWAGPLEPPQ